MADATHMAQLQQTYPDSKIHVANMGPIWGRQDPGGPHVGPTKLAIWVHVYRYHCNILEWTYSIYMCAEMH